MDRKKKIMIGAAALIILAGIAAGIWFWLGRGNGNGGNTAYVQKVSDIVSGPSVSSRFSGVVEAQKTLDIKKDSSRTIAAVYVAEGQSVMPGTQLFQYDVRDAQNRIASANLDIEGLNNQISVYAGDGSTEAQLAVAGYELQIRQIEADIARYQQEIDQAMVVSTIGGVVKAVNENGGYDQNGSELPIVSITETGEFRVKGKVSEQLIGTIMTDMDVIVRSRVDENRTWKGKISVIETEPANDQQNGYYYESGERSSSYPFYVSLESTDGLMLGQHVLIEPDYGQSEPREGLWLYSYFLGFDENGESFVWADKNGRLEKRKVEVGAMDENTGEIQIVSGLARDDKIAWPDETVREGMKTADASEAGK